MKTNRIVVTEFAHFQPQGGMPATVPTSFSRWTDGNQLLSAAGFATERWAELDVGSGELVIVTNEAGSSPVGLAGRNQPLSEARQTEETMKSIELCFGDGEPVAHVTVRPSESSRLEPASTVRIRARSGSVKYAVHRFPK